MRTTLSGTATRGIDPEIIEQHFSEHANAACRLVARTTDGTLFEIDLPERTPTELTYSRRHDYSISYARRGTAKRGNTTYAGLVHFDTTLNALTVHDPNTGYIVLQSTPIEMVCESQ